MITRRGFLKALVVMAAASTLPTSIVAEVSKLREVADTGKIATLPADGAWHHIAFTVLDGKLTLTLDRQPVDGIAGCKLVQKKNQTYLRIGKADLDFRVCTSCLGQNFTFAAWVTNSSKGYVSDVLITAA